MTAHLLVRICRCLAVLLCFASTNAVAGWELTFSDEFGAPALDESKWKYSDYWSNQTLAGNNEKQCYQPPAVSQSGGTLRITASKQPVSQLNCKSAKSDLPYTSGMVTTAGCRSWDNSPECSNLRSFSQAYGYFEIRAKLPKGKGFWSAFWLLPMDGTWPPEIDIMEALGHQPKTAYQTYHFKDTTGKAQRAGQLHVGVDFTATFNTFALDWRPGLLIWYVNRQEVFRYAGDAVISKPMYMLINLAVGGYWPGDPDDATPFPSVMEIDYVRVYKRTVDGTSDDHPRVKDAR